MNLVIYLLLWKNGSNFFMLQHRHCHKIIIELDNLQVKSPLASQIKQLFIHLRKCVLH